MICVPDAVNQLFPDQDLSSFQARKVGYGIGDIQRMLPPSFVIEPLYVHYKDRARGRDIRALIKETDVKVPLFFFTKHHCFLEYYDPAADKIGEYNTDTFFEVDSIYKVCCVLDANSRKLIGVK